MGIGKWFGEMLGGSVAETAKGLSSVVNDFMETPDEKRAAELVLKKLNDRPQELQVELNKVGAAHRSVFVAGWRPFIGWICGICLALYFIPQFVLGAFLWVKMCLAQEALLPYPVNVEAITKLVYAMLGMGSLRMIDKVTGKSK